MKRFNSFEELAALHESERNRLGITGLDEISELVVSQEEHDYFVNEMLVKSPLIRGTFPDGQVYSFRGIPLKVENGKRD